MKRTLFLFLSSFIITALLAVGFYTLMKQNRANQGSTPATRTELPTATEEKPTETTPATESTPAATPDTPETTADETETTTPADTETATAEEPKPAEPEESLPQGRTPEHSAALAVAEALGKEDPAAALKKLTERGLVTPEAADALKTWGETHKPARVEEVGNSFRPNGERSTRYRLVSEDGSEDMLLDVVRKADGSVVVEKATPVDADKTRVNAGADSLAVAEGFVEAVRQGNMAAARGMTRGVSDAAVAGLCMIFEEGEFRLRDEKPIRNAFENEQHSGYLIYLLSKANNFPAAFGLEMGLDGQWYVEAVSLDELLASYENLAEAEGGHYFPIVKNPQGGDSLALFFGFNEYELTPRSLRQLRIVADLLKQSKGKLDISGHTDDVGSESYNMQLSEKRAEAVKAALVSFGVEAEQISTEGMGKSQPRRLYATGDTEQQIDYIRGENRRAEIYLDFQS